MQKTNYLNQVNIVKLMILPFNFFLEILIFIALFDVFGNHFLHVRLLKVLDIIEYALDNSYCLISLLRFSDLV